ncbi:hypothetical protein J2810_002990 [Chryseobacterium rhizosphaerae]|uniref:hypothetical protein n=1 Tax=Chryseobacterium rhizosphaerae TaxID=395937 RepID=UPI00285D9027|nr:hypothetical protein [Chryseobacterium rhizosphaerae]MDR6546921.1 hypothetical protein [Chryseobacterium rhizosphaerae]
MKKLKKIKGGLSRNEMRKVSGGGLPPEDSEGLGCPSTTCISDDICTGLGGTGSCGCRIMGSYGFCTIHG